MKPNRTLPEPLHCVLLLALAVGAGCGSDEPALEVGNVAFQENDLLGLSEDRVRDLAALTAFTLAVARDEVDVLGEPLKDRWREERRVERLRDELRLEAAGVDREVLEAHYDQNPELELVVRHILFMADRDLPDDAREPARREAEEALERARSGEAFPELAAELSEEPGAAEREGLLTPGRRDTWVTEFWETASALDEGEISEVVDTPFGFHVLRLEERRTVPFEAARPTVASEVAAELPDDPVWDRWTDEARRELEVDPSALVRWRDGAAEEDEALVRWSEGSVTVGELDRRMVSLPASDGRRVERMDDSELEEWMVEEALHFRAAHEAREKEVELPSTLDDELEQEWRQRVGPWLHFMELADGLPEADVAERARELLGATGQNVDIARRELREHRPLLLAYERVRWPEDPGDSGDGG